MSSATQTLAEPFDEPSIPEAPRVSPVLFGVTILISSCLLFLVQPLISKLILPWFGGSAAVWITCMLFFQAGLLGGYLYAHVLTRFLSARKQAIFHAVLVTVSIAVLPILPNARWLPKPGADPTWYVFAVLATAVGLPYIILSSTSPLLQSWYAAGKQGVLPYRYFALSNAGSMAALISYPVFIEPFLTGHSQVVFWTASYIVFALLCILTARLSHMSPDRPPAQESLSLEKLPRDIVALWLALAACASTLLLTVTNLLTQNIAPVPLLWVAPLSLYLLTFILCFERDFWYRRWLFLPLLPAALWWLASHTETIETVDVKKVVPLICASLFVCCMVCHGELARLKPAASHLTTFYLCLSIGGALGGLIVAVLAPHMFNAVYEYPLSYLACAALVLFILWRSRAGWWDRKFPKGVWLTAVAATVALASYAVHETWLEIRYAIFKGRNFYGALLVEDVDDDVPIRLLSHGTITHGLQIRRLGQKAVPTSYYGRESGIGLTYRILEKTGPVKLGVVGLGAGTMAAYGRGGDTIRFYDLNPMVVDIAKKNFSYLADCPAHVEIALGDARLSLAQEPSQQFDILVIDAFSGDAIPVHLLTRQAFNIYWRHLKPGGVLAVHISNHYLDLAPIVELDSRARHKTALQVENDQDDSQQVYASTWILQSNRAGFFTDDLLKDRTEAIKVPPQMKPWTDDFTSLWPILRLGAAPTTGAPEAKN